MGWFSKKKSDVDVVSIDTVIAQMGSVVVDVRDKIRDRLKELEFKSVQDLSSRSLQFYQREIGSVEAKYLADVLKSKYNIELQDLSRSRRTPGDPPVLDASYSVPRF